jgi:hypothetical protein
MPYIYVTYHCIAVFARADFRTSFSDRIGRGYLCATRALITHQSSAWSQRDTSYTLHGKVLQYLIPFEAVCIVLFAPLETSNLLTAFTSLELSGPLLSQHGGIKKKERAQLGL